MPFFRKKPLRDEPPRRRQAGAPERTLSSLKQESALFQRNRTLTGSISSRVSSANELGGALKSSRVQAHELVHQRRRIGGILLIVIFAATVVAILLMQFTAHVTVSLGTVPGVSTSPYEQTIDEYLNSHPFERFRFALNVQNLANYIRKKDPEVAAIMDVSADGFVTSRVSMRLRTPIVGWQMGDKQYYVDASGVSFSKTYGGAPSVQIIDQSGVQLQAGSAVVSSRFLSYVGRTVALAADRQLVVQVVIIPLGTTREIELHIKGYSYPARLSIDRPVGEQVEDMARAIHYFQQKGETPEYVDVRVGGKAYYR